MSKRFELSTDAKEVSWYLGVSVERNWKTRSLKICQSQYVNDLLKRFNMEYSNPVLTPMEVGQRLSSEDCPKFPDKLTGKQYQQLVGSLNYLVACTRPDLAFPVSQCARFMSNPGPSHVAAAKRILRYAKGTVNEGITYTQRAENGNQLYAFADADHAGDPEGRRSVTGYAVMLNGGAISWESKRQKLTALSSAEAEYYAASAAACDVAYLRRVMSMMGFAQKNPTPVAEDNIACIYMSRTSAMYNKGKHIDTMVYRLRELVQDGVVELYHVGTNKQAANIFTKSLPSNATQRHHTTLAGVD